MSASAWDYGLPPDDPLRRVVWVLPLAVALVVLLMYALGKFLRSAAPPEQTPPPPVQAEIYELPAVKGPVPAPGREHPAPARQPRALPRAPVAARAAAEHALREHARPRLPRAPLVAPPARGAAPSSPPSRAAPAQSSPRIDWSRMGESVQSAVASTLAESEYQRVRDPHSMVARYYLAAVLRKLERVGEMSYTGTMIGEVTVMIVIGPDGALDSLQVWRSSGNSALDDYAQRIVRMSAPFAPFSARLERQTMQLKLAVNMLFEGYRDVDVR